MGRQGRVGVDGGLESFDRELSLCSGYPGELGAAGVELGRATFLKGDMARFMAEHLAVGRARKGKGDSVGC